jgi:hypothetical protein
MPTRARSIFRAARRTAPAWPNVGVLLGEFRDSWPYYAIYCGCLYRTKQPGTGGVGNTSYVRCRSAIASRTRRQDCIKAELCPPTA